MVATAGQGLLWIVGVGLLFVIFSQLRFALNLGILERPLAMGLIWGLLTGEVGLSLSVALCYELFWLDLIPAGTFVPPNAAASTLASLALVHFFGYQTASQAVFPLLFCLPLAWVGARLEQMQRSWQNASYNRLLQCIRSSRPEACATTPLVMRSMVQMGVVNFLFFTAALLVLIGLFGLLRGSVLPRPTVEFIAWGHLWLAASLGGLLALRTVRAFSVLAVCVVLAAILGLTWPA